MSIKHTKFDQKQWSPIATAAIYASIAREHYVTARVSMISQRWYSAALLMEQSIELYIKAFLFLQYKKRTWKNGSAGHALKDLLKSGEKDIPLFKSILSNAAYADLINDLETGYNDIRFGESSINVSRHKALKIYDVIMYSFITEFAKEAKIKTADQLIVHEQCVKQFTEKLKTSVKFAIVKIGS